jgi:hypothetical protein
VAVTIGRTAMTDDDGSGTTGTVFNNAWKTSVYDQIDTALALLLPLAGGTMTGAVTLLGTGNTTAASSAQFPAALTVTESSHATSNRAGFNFGSITIGQDLNGDGTRDAFLQTAGGNARLDTTGSWQVGGSAARAGTAGTNRVDIFNGTAPTSTLTNGCSLYVTTGELRVMDAAGNATLLSPHDRKTNRWIYDSTDTVRGKRLRIEVEQLLKHLNAKFGNKAWVRETPA